MITPYQSELKTLVALGIDLEAFSKFQIICLPENVFTASGVGKLRDAGESRHFAKLLIDSRVRCATALDIGIDVPFILRTSKDSRLGVVWVRDTLALPMLVGVISSLIASNIQESSSDQPKSNVHVDLYFERGEDVTRLSYKGDGETLVNILKAIQHDSIKK